MKHLPRRGIAAFEMVVFLPSLILLALILLFIGGFGIQFAEAIVEARHEAWSKRYVDDEQREWTSRPFHIGSDENQYATGESERSVKLVKIFNHWAKPRSRHLVLAGTWDHEDDLLDRSPNVQTALRVTGHYATSILSQATGDYQQVVDALNQLGDPGELVRKAASELLEEIARQTLQPSFLRPF